MDATRNELSGFTALLISNDRFKRLDDGWVRDSLLDLDWGPCSAELMDFEKASKYCAERGGRLPDAHELHSLVDFTRRDPAVNTEYFSDMKHDDWYWTRTKVVGYSGSVWCVDFRDGCVSSSNVDATNYVRPVRASQ